MAIEEIYLNETDEPEVTITRKNTATGASEVAGGLTGLTVFYADTPTGAAIHATLSANAAERSSTAGTYYGTILGTNKATHLAAYLNRTVYRRWSDGPTHLDPVTPLIVRQARTL